jgi:hypothetical protein
MELSDIHVVAGQAVLHRAEGEEEKTPKLEPKIVTISPLDASAGMLPGLILASEGESYDMDASQVPTCKPETTDNDKESPIPGEVRTKRLESEIQEEGELNEYPILADIVESNAPKETPNTEMYMLPEVGEFLTDEEEGFGKLYEKTLVTVPTDSPTVTDAE